MVIPIKKMKAFAMVFSAEDPTLKTPKRKSYLMNTYYNGYFWLVLSFLILLPPFKFITKPNSIVYFPLT